MVKQILWLIIMGMGLPAYSWALAKNIENYTEIQNAYFRGINERLTAYQQEKEDLKSRIENVQNRLDKVEQAYEGESKNIDRTLDIAEKSINHSSSIVTYMTVAIGIFTALFQIYASRDKTKAIKEAENRVASKLTTPEILKQVFNSDEFKSAYQAAARRTIAEEQDEQRAENSIAGDDVTVDNVGEV